MKSTVSFQALLQRFFTDRLMQQRQASAHTISSYRDTFRLLLRFAHKRLHKTPDQLVFEDIDAPLVAAFLNDLENTRTLAPAPAICVLLRFVRSSVTPLSKHPHIPRRFSGSFRCTASGTTGR